MSRNLILANEIVKAVMPAAHQMCASGIVSAVTSQVMQQVALVQQTLDTHNKTAATDVGFLCALEGIERGNGSQDQINATHEDFHDWVGKLDEAKMHMRQISIGELAPDPNQINVFREALANTLHHAYRMAHMLGIDPDKDCALLFAEDASNYTQVTLPDAITIAAHLSEKYGIVVDYKAHTTELYSFHSAMQQHSTNEEDQHEYQEGELIPSHAYQPAVFQ